MLNFGRSTAQKGWKQITAFYLVSSKEKSDFPTKIKKSRCRSIASYARQFSTLRRSMGYFVIWRARAEKESYLIADANAPSEFINELLSPKYKIDIIKRFQERYRTIFKCNECSTGYFVMKQGKFGQFYSCTSGEICALRHGFSEKCGRPMKLREGKFGQFGDARDMESKAINVRILVSIFM